MTIFFRTFRLSVVEGTDFATSSIGGALSGPLFNMIGAFWVFFIGGFVVFWGLPYIVFVLKESVTTPEREEKTNESESLIKEAFLYVIEGLRAIVKPRVGRRRLFILLVVCIYALTMFSRIGNEGPHRIYFAQKKYGWSENELTLFFTLDRLASWFGLWVVVPIMTKALMLHDCTIGIISALITAVGSSSTPTLKIYSDILFLGYFLPIFTSSKEWISIGSYILNWFSVSSYLLMFSPLMYVTAR